MSAGSARSSAPTYGAWLLASGKGLEWNFYGFAIPAVIGAVLIAVVPAVRLAGARSKPAELRLSSTDA